jgi:hypothetical protein
MPTALTNTATVLFDLAIAFYPIVIVWILGIAAMSMVAYLSFRDYRSALSELEKERSQRQEDRLQAIAAEPEPQPLVDFNKPGVIPM